VRDGKFLIAAGVSAGIDLGLEVIKILFSESLAAEVAELIEYSISAHQQR
jgi:cyclohexyl-isocyanide hydratase